MDRLNEINTNYQGYDMQIVDYKNSQDIIVQFLDKNMAKVHTQYFMFKNGRVNNPFHKTVYNIGYLGNSTSGNGKGQHSTSYKCWFNMMTRCYNKVEQKDTYKDCYVCEEWHNFSNFEKWFDENYYTINNKRMCLDKDILVKGNKEYSPNTCVFVPNEINVLFTKTNKNRGKLPIGVTKSGKYYRARCGNGSARSCKNIGSYHTISEAFMAYKIYKEEYIKEVANRYKNIIPKNLYNAMINYQVEIND